MENIKRVKAGDYYGRMESEGVDVKEAVYLEGRSIILLWYHQLINTYKSIFKKSRDCLRSFVAV